MINIIFLTTMAFAQTRSNLFTKPDLKTPPSTAQSKSSPMNVSTKAAAGSGNLPSEYLSRHGFSASENPIVVPTNKSGQRLAKAPIGSLVQGEIKESLIAFADAKAPIRVIIKSGDLKGSILIGEATLEKNSKRILISLKSVRTANAPQVWKLEASVLDQKGILGVEGRLVSSEGRFFAGEFTAAAAAGYADSTIERSQNVLGNYVEQPGPSTFAKKALAAALSKTSERFAEKLKNVPEYSILEGPFPVQILITDQPILSE